MLSRTQQARCATYLARPQLVLFFVGVMGVAVALSFFMGVAIFVWPHLPTKLTSWFFMGASAINLLVLAVRSQVLQRGWLPVSVADFERGDLQEAWAVPEQARVLLQRVRASGWLQWKDVYDLLPQEDTWLRSIQRWRPGRDQVADRRWLRAQAAPVARRAEQGDHVGGRQALPSKARLRA